MKFIQPNAEIWEQKFPDSSSENFQEDYIKCMYEHIEKCGRVCYKSEDHIKEGSAKDFVQRMIDSKHYAMLEHGTIYLFIKVSAYDTKMMYHVEDYKKKYSKVLYLGTDDNEESDYLDIMGNPATGDMQYVITTNYRVIIENNWEEDLQYLCLPTEYHVKRNTICFTTDIGVTREFNRHRVDSIAEESTRYCNYTKGKFGSEITYTMPAWVKEEDIPKDLFKSDEWTAIEYWAYCLATCEDTYNNLIRLGWKPQQARQVLPLNTKSTLIHTAFETDWEHFFDLRVHGVTGAPHPNAKYVADIAYEKMRKCKNKNLNGYILPNRYNFNNILSFVKKEHDIEYYEIKWDVNAPTSIGVTKGEDDEHPYAIDPCGGPYMSIGGFEIKEKSKRLTDILWVKGKPVLLGFE